MNFTFNTAKNKRLYFVLTEPTSVVVVVLAYIIVSTSHNFMLAYCTHEPELDSAWLRFCSARSIVLPTQETSQTHFMLMNCLIAWKIGKYYGVCKFHDRDFLCDPQTSLIFLSFWWLRQPQQSSQSGPPISLLFVLLGTNKIINVSPVQATNLKI